MVVRTDGNLQLFDIVPVEIREVELEAAIVVSRPAVEERLYRLTGVESEMLWVGLRSGLAGQAQEQRETDRRNAFCHA